jgi:hypothetical protein
MTAHFSGPAYDPLVDRERLTKQHARVRDLMRDGQWRSLQDIATTTGDPETSISAQLRHLRKPRFGGHSVEKRWVALARTWEYRLAIGGIDR